MRNSQFSIGTPVEILNDGFYGMMVGKIVEHLGLCSIVEITVKPLGTHKIIVRNEQLEEFRL